MRNRLIYAALVVVWIGYFIWEWSNNNQMESSVSSGDDIPMDVILTPSLLLLITAFLIFQLSRSKDQ
mgnify:CR=1 FL=1